VARRHHKIPRVAFVRPLAVAESVYCLAKENVRHSTNVRMTARSVKSGRAAAVVRYGTGGYHMGSCRGTSSAMIRRDSRWATLVRANGRKPGFLKECPQPLGRLSGLGAPCLANSIHRHSALKGSTAIPFESYPTLTLIAYSIVPIADGGGSSLAIRRRMTLNPDIRTRLQSPITR
jgi:hypothetical protein